MSLYLRIDEVLLEYDGPALLTAGDAKGNRYVAYQDLPESELGYIVLPVSESKLKQMVEGVLSVRTVVESSPVFPGFFECDLGSGSDGQFRLMGKLSTRQLIPRLLPSADLKLSFSSQSASLVETATRRQSTIACLALYSLEAEERHVIDGTTLNEALKALLRLVKRGFSEFSKNLPVAERERLRAINADRINILAFQPGSFEVLIEPEAKPDLFGFQHTSRVFSQITELLNQSDSIDKSITIVRGYGGHFGRAYGQFLEVIASRSAPIVFSWADSDKGGGSSVRIDVPKASALLTALRTSTELMSESLTVHGVLEKADINKKKWGLRNADGVAHHGEAEGSFVLDGLILGGRYSFKCREVIEEEAGTGKETTKLFAYESINHSR